MRNGKEGARMGAEYAWGVLCFWFGIGTWIVFYSFLILYCIYRGVKKIYDYISNKRTCNNSGVDKFDG